QLNPTLLGIDLNGRDALQCVSTGIQFNLNIPKGTILSLDQRNNLKTNINYFLTALTIDDSEFWVNLNPSQPNRLTGTNLAYTDMGKHLLLLDLKLKKDTAFALFPGLSVGATEYWQRVFEYAKRLQKNNQSPITNDKLNPNNQRTDELKNSRTVSIPTTFRVWIVPDKAEVYEDGKGSCVITKSTLKVLLESEYLQLPQTPSLPKRGIKGEFDNNQELQSYCESQLKELILPNLTYKVNHDPSYEPLRQIYNAIILAKWYKENVSAKGGPASGGKSQSEKLEELTNQRTDELKNAFSSIINTNNLNGLISKEPVTKEQIFAAYLDSVKQGEYHLSKTHYNQELKANIRRSYVSGGATFVDNPIASVDNATARGQSRVIIDANCQAQVVLDGLFTASPTDDLAIHIAKEAKDKKQTVMHEAIHLFLHIVAKREKNQSLAGLGITEDEEEKIVELFIQALSHGKAIVPEDLEHELHMLEQRLGKTGIEQTINLINLLRNENLDPSYPEQIKEILERITGQTITIDMSKTQEELAKLKQEIEIKGGLGRSLQSPKIDLANLIGLLKSTYAQNNDYQDLMKHPEKLAKMVNDFTGNPQRLDTLVHQQGAYHRQAAVELVSNAIDAVMAEMGIALIGRFGIGAFQCLAELEDKDDYVSWTSSKDGRTAYRVIITRENDTYYYQSQIITQGVRKGVQVKVYKKNYSKKSQSDLNEFIRSKFYLNNRLPIYLNGELINPLEDVLFINGDKLNYLSSTSVNISIGSDGYSITDSGIGMDADDLHRKLLIPHKGKDLPAQGIDEASLKSQIKIFYRRQNGDSVLRKKAKSSIHLQVAGVIIESFETEGFVLPQDLVIELPASTHLTEDRQHIQLNAQTVKAIKLAVDKIIQSATKDQIELINGISYMLEKIKERDEAAQEILQYMANSVKSWASGRLASFPQTVFLPNQEEFLDIDIPQGKEVIYINNAVLPFDPEQIPGSSEMDAPVWQSDKYSLWTVPFKKESRKVSFRFENYILLSQGHYKLHKDNPAALDLELNPIDTSYEPGGYEKPPLGRLLPIQETTAKKKMPEARTDAKKEALPDSIKGIIEELRDSLPLDLFTQVSRKVTSLFKRSKKTEAVTSKIITWLGRFKTFSSAVKNVRNATSRIIHTFELDSGDIEKVTLLKDYTKLKKSTNYRQGLELNSPTFSTLLPDGNLAVCNYNDNSISIIDPDRGSLVKKLKDANLGLNGPRGITLLANGNLAVCNADDDSISIINPARGSLVKKLNDANLELNRPLGITLLANGNLAVCNYNDNSISIIDPDRGSLVNKLNDENLGLN
ncbi:MAG: hypothetical protein AB1755_04905, partial [Candidatus Omnitrophota bacterium]